MGKFIDWVQRLFNEPKNEVKTDENIGECITDCEHLPLEAFIKADCEQDYSGLIKSGNPSSDELFKAWVLVLSEFYTLTENRECDEHIRFVSKMEILNTKIFHVSSAIFLLKIGYYPEVIEGLRAFGYDKPFTPESYIKDVERVEIEIKNDKLKLVRLKLQYDEKEAKKGKNEKKRSDYTKILMSIARHREVKTLRASELNTLEYAIMYKEILDYSEQVKSKQR